MIPSLGNIKSVSVVCMYSICMQYDVKHGIEKGNEEEALNQGQVKSCSG